MAVIVNGDGILTGISSLATALTDITSGRGTVTGVATVGTLQLGAGVSISSPRTQTAAIFTNNTEFLTVDDAGRVGVGTITPNSDAHPENEKKINVGFITAKSVAGDIDARNVVVAGISTFVGALNATLTGNVTGNVTGNISGGTVAGSTGTFTSDVSIADAIVHSGDNSKIRFPANDMISFETGGTEVARFNNSQLFLVGTDSAVNSSSAKVQIAHTNANARLDISRFSDDSAPPYFEFFKTRNNTIGGNGLVQDGDELGRIRWNGNNGSGSMFAAQIQVFAAATPGSGSDMPAEMSFSTTPDGSGTPSQRLRIDKNGRVGIGIFSNINKKLDIATSSSSDGIRVRSTGNTYNEIEFDANRTGADNHIGRILANWNGSVVSYMAFNTGSDTSNKDDGNILFNTSASGNSAVERLRIATDKVQFSVDAKVASDNTLDLGASGARWKDLYLGGSLFLGGTGTANELEDYEEGVWTPNYTYSNGGAPTLSEALGQYRKIGDYVYCTFTTTNSAQGGGSGNWVLNNLPFTSSGDAGTRHHGGITYFTGMSTGLRSNMVIYNAGGTTSVYIYHQNSSNEQIENVTRNYISSNTTIRGFIMFMTTT